MNEHEKYYQSFLKTRIIEMIEKQNSRRVLNFVYHYLLKRDEN